MWVKHLENLKNFKILDFERAFAIPRFANSICNRKYFLIGVVKLDFGEYEISRFHHFDEKLQLVNVPGCNFHEISSLARNSLRCGVAFVHANFFSTCCEALFFMGPFSESRGRRGAWNEIRSSDFSYDGCTGTCV